MKVINNNVNGTQTIYDNSVNSEVTISGDNNNYKSQVGQKTDVDRLAEQLLEIIRHQELPDEKKNEMIENIEQMNSEVNESPDKWGKWKEKLETLSIGTQLVGQFIQALNNFNIV